MKTLMKGNIALCEGALAAGLKAYFGYPITPQTEIPEYLSRVMVEQNKVFVQAESEIAAANMLLGAAVTGIRAMTSSSSPGISLKQEAISYMAAMELPAVIINVQRGGPGLGNIAGSQMDYFQSVKGGGHGGYKLIVLAPNSAQEMYEMSYDSFDLAFKHRIPVLILADGIIGQTMEPVELNRELKEDLPIPDWALTGCAGRKPQSFKSLFMKEGILEKHNLVLQEKYKDISANETQYETFMTDDADIIFCAYGIASRMAKSAVKRARNEGIKAGLIRPKTLYPFPSAVISSFAKREVKFLTIELNYGQMVEDVRLSVNGASLVEFLGRGGGGVVSEDEILEKVRGLK